MNSAMQPVSATASAASVAVMGTASPAVISTVTDAELPIANRVVADSIGSWGIAQRVQRLTLPYLLYDAADLQHMSLVMTHRGGSGLAVAAWEDHLGGHSDSRDALLHGLYVTPSWQRHGLGSNLLEYASREIRARGFDGLLAKVWRESTAFFFARGFRPATGSASEGLYPIQMWKALQ
jgi:GNAT superfamily N-acetyltransferase